MIPTFGTLALRRTRSFGSMPRIKVLAQFAAVIMIVCGVGMVFLNLDFYRAIFRNEGSKSSGWIAEKNIIHHQYIKQAQGVLKRVDRSTVQEEATRYQNICTSLGHSLRLIIWAKDGERRQVEFFLQQLSRLQNVAGCKVDLQFSLSGNVIDPIRNQIAAFEWSHGKVYTHLWEEGISPAQAFINSWHPEQKEFSLFFDSLDVVIDRSLIKFTLAMLNKYFFDGTEQRNDSLLIEKIAGMTFGEGISLEKGKKEEKEETAAMVLTQVPKGALLATPWFWTKLQDYIQWKQVEGNNIDFAVNLEGGSKWTLLAEYLHITGMLLISPPKCLVCSSHLPIPKLKVEKAIKTFFKKLNNLKIYNTKDKMVNSIDDLVYRGESVVKLSKPIKKCILDTFTDPIIPMELTRNQYFTYEPYGSHGNQVDALQKALIISNLLNRTLIIPPLLNPYNHSDLIPMSTVYALKFDWLRFATFETFQFFAHQIKRHTVYMSAGLSYEATLALASPTLGIEHINAGEAVVLPVLNKTDSQLLGDFAGCKDDILAFKHFDNLVETFNEPLGRENLMKLRSGWGLASKLQWYLETFRSKKLTTPLLCTIYSRGDGERPCGFGYEDANSALIKYRSCQAGPKRILDYAIEMATERNITIGGIYMLHDTPFPIDEPVPETFNNLPIYTSALLAKNFLLQRDLEITKYSASFVAEIVEREFCLDAEVFINNIFSPLGNALAKVRQDRGRASLQLGHLINVDQPLVKKEEK